MKYMLLIYQGTAPTPRDSWALLSDKTQTIEGPFVPVEQAVDGYLMFETDDADAAIELAARIPAARLGGAVEVRQVVEP
jgi:hypothetical protein